MEKFRVACQRWGRKIGKVNDTRLDPIFETPGELNLPVLIHIADPVAFFDPLDANNERWEELTRTRIGTSPAPPFPAFIDLLNDFRERVKRHPHTTFIGRSRLLFRKPALGGQHAG